MKANVKTILTCPNCGNGLYTCSECGSHIDEKTDFRCRTVNFGEYRHICSDCDEERVR